MELLLKDLVKTYANGVIALNHLSLDITTGMFGLLGPNGAGKSTLMRTIATLQQPDSGSLRFNDIDILNAPMQLRRVLGYLPQEFGVYPKLSAQRLLHYFATLKGIASKKDRNIKVEEVLRLTNLYEVRKKRVSGFSGGMKQRFGIAQLLLNNPQLIIVDEPTAGLDPAERNRFLRVLRDIGTNNIVLFSTHLVEDVKELCTDMAIIHQGMLLLRATPSAAIQSILGKVWTKQIDKSDLESHQNDFSVLSFNYNENGTMTIRVFADHLPNDSFQIAERPTLEDVYFISLK